MLYWVTYFTLSVSFTFLRSLTMQNCSNSWIPRFSTPQIKKATDRKDQNQNTAVPSKQNHNKNPEVQIWDKISNFFKFGGFQYFQFSVTYIFQKARW